MYEAVCVFALCETIDIEQSTTRNPETPLILHFLSTTAIGTIIGIFTVYLKTVKIKIDI
jgi:hypothetical protein